MWHHVATGRRVIQLFLREYFKVSLRTRNLLLRAGETNKSRETFLEKNFHHGRRISLGIDRNIERLNKISLGPETLKGARKGSKYGWTHYSAVSKTEEQ